MSVMNETNQYQVGYSNIFLSCFSGNLHWWVKDSVSNPIWLCEGERGFTCFIKQYLDTGWVSYISTKFWHYPPGDDIRPHRLRGHCHRCPLFQIPWQVQIVPCTSDQLTVAEGPPTPSTYLINFLECCTQLRKLIYSLAYLFCYKGYESAARCKDSKVRSWTKEFLFSWSLELTQ